MKRRRRFSEDEDWEHDEFFSEDENFDACESGDDEFERVREYIETVFERVSRGELPTERRLVYGFSIKTGPDGKPLIQRFGNTRLFPIEEQQVEEKIIEEEPLCDVFEEKDYVAVTVDIPGAKKNSITVRPVRNKITISVDSDERRYYKEIALPAEIEPASVKWTYRNGVLDITAKKARN